MRSEVSWQEVASEPRDLQKDPLPSMPTDIQRLHKASTATNQQLLALRKLTSSSHQCHAVVCRSTNVGRDQMKGAAKKGATLVTAANPQLLSKAQQL